MCFTISMYLLYWTIISSLILLVLMYIIFNLYKKNKIYEDWVLDTKDKASLLYENIREVDSKDIFEKDDEVGVVFEQIKELISSFNKKVQD